MKALQIRLAIEVQPEKPTTANKVLAFLEEMRAQGINVAVDGPSVDELEALLDEVEAALRSGEISEERAELLTRVQRQRALNRFLRSMGR